MPSETYPIFDIDIDIPQSERGEPGIRSSYLSDLGLSVFSLYLSHAPTSAHMSEQHTITKNQRSDPDILEKRTCETRGIRLIRVGSFSDCGVAYYCTQLHRVLRRYGFPILHIYILYSRSE
jgi:hypothetical protein